jgi:ISXO2-like transposase domain
VTRLVTDDWPSYQNLPGVRHNAIALGPMAAHIALPWIHRLFSNLKRWGLGVYHGLRKTNLQHYLDEFVSASIGAGHDMLQSAFTAASHG